MITRRAAALFTVALALFSNSSSNAGEFDGDLVFLPEGCQNTDARICMLGALLTYRSSRDGLVWQAETWVDASTRNGTTDGASIPPWAQPIVGDAYDPAFLRAAIIHDHYCYKENRVRTWRQTHRMFFDGLIDSGVAPLKAKVMYFAVYWRGPRWVNLVPGNNCGENCINNFNVSGQRWEGDRFSGEQFHEELQSRRADLQAGLDLDLSDIEARADALEPDNFFLKHGATYVPIGPNDPNVLPAL